MFVGLLCVYGDVVVFCVVGVDLVGLVDFVVVFVVYFMLVCDLVGKFV